MLLPYLIFLIYRALFVLLFRYHSLAKTKLLPLLVLKRDVKHRATVVLVESCSLTVLYVRL